MTANQCRVPYGGDEHMLELDSSDGWTTFENTKNHKLDAAAYNQYVIYHM
jgi:hypothetical protein